MLEYSTEALVPPAPDVVGLRPGLPVPALLLDTSPWPTRRQFPAWLEQVGDIVETVTDAPAETGFRAQLVAWNLGGMLLFRTRLPAVAYRRSLRQCRADGLDHWILTVAERSDGGAFSVACMNQPTAGYSRAGASVVLCVPRDFLRQSALSMDRLHGIEVASPLGRLLGEFLLNLAARMPEVEPADYPGIRSSIRAMIEGCIVPERLGLPDEIEPVQATLLEKARRLIQQRLDSPTLGVEELCRDLAVSRSRLYRLFEPLGGVVHHIRYRRLLDAHRALADAENRLPIVDIAAERGFIDPADFSRAFKREFGYRPSDARAGLHCLPTPPRRSGETLADLLHNLR